MVKTNIVILKLIAIFVFTLFAGTAFAAVPSVQIEQPKSPTNQNSFNITFVTLDTQNRATTVKCFKKGPSDGGFSQFGSDINIAAGGNTGNCSVNSSIANTDGTYHFYVTAQADADSATSQTVDVELKTQSPGTPTSYSKSKSICDYKIEFTTADDSGRTSKVEVYRSENTSFNVDNGSKVGQVFIGSSANGSFINTPPDCSKDYYYAIRAFDSVGNGSASVGDSIVRIVNPTASASTSTNSGGGAIPVSQSSVTGQGEVLGNQTAATEEANQQTPPGSDDENNQATPEVKQPFGSWGKTVLLILAAAAFYYFYRRNKK